MSVKLTASLAPIPTSRPRTLLAPSARGLVALLVLVVLLFTGCSALAPSVPPGVTLADLRFTDVTVFETAGVMVVRLTNENPEPMLIEGGSYDLFVDGVRIGQALSDHRIEVPALATATDEMEIYLNNLAIATRVKTIFETGAFDYRIKARIYARGDLGRRTHKVSKDGFFSFDQVGRDH